MPYALCTLQPPPSLLPSAERVVFLRPLSLCQERRARRKQMQNNKGAYVPSPQQIAKMREQAEKEVFARTRNGAYGNPVELEQPAFAQRWHTRHVRLSPGHGLAATYTRGGRGGGGVSGQKSLCT